MVTAFQVRFDPWMPPVGAYEIGYTRQKLGINGLAIGEFALVGEPYGQPGEARAAAEFNAHKREVTARLAYKIAEDFASEFNYGDFISAIERAPTTSPEAFFASVLSAMKISYKTTKMDSIPVSALNIRGDQDLCFAEIELAPREHTCDIWETQWNLGRYTYDIRFRLSGMFRYRFGLTPQAWATIGRRLGAPVLDAMAVRLGHTSARAFLMTLGGVAVYAGIGVVGGVGIMYGLEFASQLARERAHRQRMLLEYSRGYVETLFVRLGTPSQTADARHAQTPTSVAGAGNQRTANRARSAGVAQAAADIVINGDGRSGQIAARRSLFQMIGIDRDPALEFSGNFASELSSIVMACHDYLMRQNVRTLSEYR